MWSEGRWDDEGAIAAAEAKAKAEAEAKATAEAEAKAKAAMRAKMIKDLDATDGPVDGC